MVNFKKSFVLVAITMFILSSCKTTFTAEMKRKLESNNVELSKIQYYNSSKIILKRTLLDSESDVIDGKIKLENGRRIQEIVIDRNTPGVLAKAGTGFMDLHFEEGQNRKIRFEFNPTTGDFRLLDRSVMYDGEKWFRANHSSIARIKVRKNDISNTITESRRVKGLKISE